MNAHNPVWTVTPESRSSRLSCLCFLRSLLFKWIITAKSCFKIGA